MLGISISSVHKMVESGALDAWRTQGGHRRISLESVAREMARVSEGREPVAESVLHILVVEDNPLMLKTYEQMFKSWGGQVVADYAGDGAAALLMLAQKRPDILITDLVMQPFDGHFLIRTIRANSQLASLKIVVVAGAPPVKASATEFDARTVIYRKPVQFERLAGYLDAQVQQLALTRARTG